MQTLTAPQVRDMLVYVADCIIAEKPLLTEVDSKIGDGDHGIGMSGGMSKAKNTLLQKEPATVNEVFRTTGMTMLNSMGGASGVIFGSMFMGGVKGMDDTETADLAALAAIFERGLAVVQQRGGAKPGDKTMVDAYAPACAALAAAVSAGKTLQAGMRDAEAAAKDGVERTKEYVAKFGRAKSLMERAVGHQDAGATSVWIIFRSMADWLEKNPT